MRKRRHWGVVIRYLHQTGNSELARGVSRLRPHTRIAVFHTALIGCPAARPHRPRTIIRAMERNQCVVMRINDVEAQLLADGEEFVINAVFVWGERHLVGRLLLTSDRYRNYYLAWHLSPQRPLLYEYARYRWIRRLANRRRKVRRKGLFHGLFLGAVMVYLGVGGILALMTYGHLTPKERGSFDAMLEEASKMALNWFLG